MSAQKPAWRITATIPEMMSCLRRELAMRKSVYPKLVQSGRMKPIDMAQEIGTMTDALTVLSFLNEINPDRAPDHRRDIVADLIAQNSFIAMMMREYKGLCRDKQALERRVDDLRLERNALTEKLRECGVVYEGCESGSAAPAEVDHAHE